jgi:uncharacterized membrane protein
MNESKSKHRPFGRTVVAALVLLLAAWILLGLIVHVVSAVFGFLVFIAAAVAVIWALRVLL